MQTVTTKLIQTMAVGLLVLIRSMIISIFFPYKYENNNDNADGGLNIKSFVPANQISVHLF